MYTYTVAGGYSRKKTALKIIVKKHYMKKINFYFFSLILIIVSCEKDDNIVSILPRPAGKHLSEIKLYGFPWLEKMDTLKYAEFEYDKNRYLKTIKLFIPETNTLNSYKELSYNKNGQICQINWFDIDGNIIERNIFEYKDNLEFEELYNAVSGELKLYRKNRYETDKANNCINKYSYFWQGSNLIESEYFTKYYYNLNGNIYKTHYRGDNYEFIEEYQYDNMINPFSNLKFPFSENTIPSIDCVQYLSKNNVIYRKITTLDYMNRKDTLISMNDSEIFRYKYKDSSLIDKNGYEFYKYRNLE